MEITYSTLCIHSLISSNFNDYTSCFEMIHLIKGSVQTSYLIDVMNPLMMCSPLIDPVHQSHSLCSNICDRILEWIENLYLKKIHNKGKVMLALFLPKYLGGKHDMIFLDPPCEEIDEHRRIVRRMGHFGLGRWLCQVPIIFTSFPKLNYIFSCFCDPYNDKIAEWLEDSYRKNVQGNGKVMLALFLNDDYKGKYDVFLFNFDTLPFLLLVFNFVFIAGLELLRWLH
jgi:hypothetical protein